MTYEINLRLTYFVINYHDSGLHLQARLMIKIMFQDYVDKLSGLEVQTKSKKH